jgi:hypothetical protein
MPGKRRVNDDELYAYLDGKHQATNHLERNQTYKMSEYQIGAHEWGYSGNLEHAFLKGVREIYANESEVRNRSKEEKEFPITKRPRSQCKPANQVDVQALWGEMYK